MCFLLPFSVCNNGWGLLPNSRSVRAGSCMQLRHLQHKSYGGAPLLAETLNLPRGNLSEYCAHLSGLFIGAKPLRDPRHGGLMRRGLWRGGQRDLQRQAVLVPSQLCSLRWPGPLLRGSRLCSRNLRLQYLPLPLILLLNRNPMEAASQSATDRIFVFQRTFFHKTSIS